MQKLRIDSHDFIPQTQQSQFKSFYLQFYILTQKTYRTKIYNKLTLRDNNLAHSIIQFGFKGRFDVKSFPKITFVINSTLFQNVFNKYLTTHQLLRFYLYFHLQLYLTCNSTSFDLAEDYILNSEVFAVIVKLSRSQDYYLIQRIEDQILQKIGGIRQFVSKKETKLFEIRNNFEWIIQDQQIRFLMEPQEKQEPNNSSIRFYKDLAMNNQTTKCSFILNNSIPSQYDLDFFMNPPNDLSFQIQLHRQNVQSIKTVATKYIESCLLGGYQKKLGFKDSSLYLYKQRPCLQKQGNVLDALISQNSLLKQEMKKDIYMILKEEQNLTCFLKEIPEVFGFTVGKEITFIIYQILKEKNKKYKQTFTQKQGILPKLNCFQGYENQIIQQLITQCPVYEQIELEEVVAFAEKGIDLMAKNLYFADTYIKILNLKEITAQINSKADLIKQFTVLLKQISRSVFLTLAGGTEPSQNITSLFDLTRQISLTQFSELQLPHKSASRPHGQYSADEIFDFLSKKTKL